MNISRALLAIAAVSVGVAFVACDNPDPQGRYDEFGKNTEEFRSTTSTNNQPNNAVQVDFSGQYFLSISTSILPSSPLFFDTTVTVDENFVANFSFQPLTVDTNAAPRTPVGDPIVVNGVQLNEDGTFELELTDAAVDGSANPISGGNIVATIKLNGFVTSATTFCGTASGQVSQPTMLDLAGSTFGAIIPETEDLTLVTPVGKCEAGVLPTPDGGMDAGTDMDEADMGPQAKIRCPSGLAGDYVLTFKADVQSARSQVKMTLVASDDDTLCYTGEILSLTDDSKIGDVEYFHEADGIVKGLIPNFAIPPGATPLLPDGGNSRLELTASSWTSEGSCGELFFSIVGTAITSPGDFAAIRQDSTSFTVSPSMTAATCSAIIPNESCGLDAFAGTYDFKFISDTTEQAGGNPTVLELQLETNALSCLKGAWISKTTGAKIADIISAEVFNTDQTRFYLRNFIIPADPTNPIAFLRDGGLADGNFTATTAVPGTSMCGTMNLNLVEPVPISSPGNFAAEVGMEPATAGCP
ncbi:MAG: hypothetical protein R3E66_09515 [bacterium]